MMDVAIIGAGRQGNRRAKAVRECGDDIVSVAGRTSASVAKFSKEYDCAVAPDWKTAINDKRVEAVLVCTPNDSHAEISIAALRAGKHVLCEKPLARNPEEATRMLDAAKKSNSILKCGFNHRYHPAVMQAKKQVESGKMGKLIFMRSRYGMTGRADYEHDWRTKSTIAGGGQLMDQGQHVLDLFRWFGGEVSEVIGRVDTLYWDIKPLEDNAFAILRGRAGHTCMMHVSWTEWRNIFSFEAFGRDGYAKVEGLGGSYGKERLITGVRDFDAPFSEKVMEFDQGDISWREEWKDFCKAISGRSAPLGTGEDGLAAIRLASAIYESSSKGRSVRLQ